MLIGNIDDFRQKPVELAKTTIMLDHGYYPETIQTVLEQVYPESMTKIQFEISAKLSKAKKAAQGKSGFVPVAVRWVIERSNSWVERCQNLVKNFEWTLDHARTKLNLRFIRLMIKRLAV
jgi:Transposase DDE domain